jgi:glycosyltransferase involved in cell wall biosynthesis
MDKKKLKVLVVHNYTKGFATGGEGHVFEDEVKLLESNGHIVQKLFVSNSEGTDVSFFKKIKFFIEAPWSDYGYSIIKNELKRFQPDIVHVHNFFFIFSPKIFLAIREEKIPVVITLHNYRLVVPCSQMIYKNKPCEICLGKNPWRILFKRCYKNSFLASFFRYRFYYMSQKKHNWWEYIDKFIALTENGKSILIKGGLPENKILVKPNFINDPLKKSIKVGTGAIYVGTLTNEKGLIQLIREWQEIDYPLKIVGAGYLENELKQLNKNKRIVFAGLLTRQEVFEEIEKSGFLVMSSIWQESFGLVNIEALALGKPILSTYNGAMRDIIKDGYNGLFFDFNKKGNLKEKVELLNNDAYRKQLGKNARLSYLKNYTSEINYNLLHDVYLKTINDYENLKNN